MPRPAPTDLEPLIRLVDRLRAPDGCPWDREQGLEDLRAYLLEEAHEVADAIDRGDLEDLGEELGDLLFQVVFIERLAAEKGNLSLAGTIRGIHDKMVARHPHVFGGERLADAREVSEAWERRKLRERADEDRSLLDGVARSLPALTAAYRMTQKAAGVGFDWPDAGGVIAKVKEELAELEVEIDSGSSREALRVELGDLLFTVANLARKLDLDPEAALAGANLKFRRRFAAVEQGLAERGKRLDEATLEEMDLLWEAAKELET